MIIIGAKGLAKEILEILHQNNSINKLAFYDDVNDEVRGLVFDKFPILKSIEEVKDYFIKNGNEFTIGIGDPRLRNIVCSKFTKLGGDLCSTISPNSDIGHYGNVINKGCNIGSGVVITNDVIIKEGCLVNLNVTIGHDCTIGKFVELCPNVNISGNCEIGDFTFVGTSATILPDIKIGQNAVIGAGAVVTKDVPDNTMVVGIPAKAIKILSHKK